MTAALLMATVFTNAAAATNKLIQYQDGKINMEVIIIGTGSAGRVVHELVLHEETSPEEVREQIGDIRQFAIENHHKLVVELEGLCECDPGHEFGSEHKPLRQSWPSERKSQSQPKVRNWQIDHQVRCRAYPH